MARRDRIAKQDLKEDPLINTMARGIEWAKANANMLVGVVATVIIGAVLLNFWARGRTDKGFEAKSRVAAAVSNYSTGQYQRTVEMTGAILTNYSGSVPATWSQYLAAQSFLHLANFSAAENSFRAYLNESTKAPFFETAAKQGLASSLSALGRHGEAAQIYLELSKKLPEPLASSARLDAAHVLRLAGDPTQARSLLAHVKSEKNVHSRQASIELAVLNGLDASQMTEVPQPVVEVAPAAEAETPATP